MTFTDWFKQRNAESVDDYLGVLIPLDQAHLYSHSARTGKTEFEIPEEDGEPEDDPNAAKDEDEERQGMLHMKSAEYTLEGLRKEMRRGRKGDWTTYESELKPEISPLFMRGRCVLTGQKSSQNSSIRQFKILEWDRTIGNSSSCVDLGGSQTSK